MNLPPYATDNDYKRCEKIVRRVLGDEENVNVPNLHTPSQHSGNLLSMNVCGVGS